MVTIVKKDEKQDISKHVLVPKHTKLNQKEKQELFLKYKITHKDLPRISINDPAIAGMDVTTEDIIKIERPSPTSKITLFYRRVIK